MGDEDFRTIEEIEREECSIYDLELFEKRSIKEIESLVEIGAYSDVFSVKDHMDFLEKLLVKIQTIRLEEMRKGIPTLELDEEITEITHLFSSLKGILYSLKGEYKFI